MKVIYQCTRVNLQLAKRQRPEPLRSDATRYHAIVKRYCHHRQALSVANEPLLQKLTAAPFPVSPPLCHCAPNKGRTKAHHEGCSQDPPILRSDQRGKTSVVSVEQAIFGIFRSDSQWCPRYVVKVGIYPSGVSYGYVYNVKQFLLGLSWA